MVSRLRHVVAAYPHDLSVAVRSVRGGSVRPAMAGGDAEIIRLDTSANAPPSVERLVPGEVRGASAPRQQLAYSITKMMTATLCLQGVDAKSLTLEQTLDNWFPALPAADVITLRHLLNHTSGYPDYGALAAYHHAVRTSPSKPWSVDEFLAHTLAQPLLFEPGSGFAYCNVGYLLLREILQRQSGRSWTQLAALLCDRAGLLETVAMTEQPQMAALIPSVSRQVTPGGEPVDVRAHYHPGWVSHGVVAATPVDIVHFCAALFSGALISEASLAQMTTLTAVSKAPDCWQRPSYGLGLMADPGARWGPIFGHGGNGPGYESMVLHVPGAAPGPVTVCVMCAAEVGDLAERIVFDLLDVMVDA